MTLQPALFATPARTGPPMADWLISKLVADGTLGPDGVTRRARARACRKCRAYVVVGLDDVSCALEVRTDPQPLTALGEALVLLEGRRTVELHREGGRWVLDARDAHRIASRPAGTTTRQDVLAEHRCHRPLASALVGTSTFTDAIPPLPPGSPCPF